MNQFIQYYTLNGLQIAQNSNSQDLRSIEISIKSFWICRFMETAFSWLIYTVYLVKLCLHNGHWWSQFGLMWEKNLLYIYDIFQIWLIKSIGHFPGKRDSGICGNSIIVCTTGIAVVMSLSGTDCSDDWSDCFSLHQSLIRGLA